MSAAINDALAEASASLDRIRNDLNYADSRFSRNPRERDRIACLNASAYIWLTAVVERYVRKVFASTLEEINARSVKKTNLKYCLFALACSADLDSMENAKKLRKWQKRAAAFGAVVDAQPVWFNTAVLPIDGRTIRADHLETIWQTFGLAGNPIPHPKFKLALADLADGRNNLAHGEVDPVAFGRRKSIYDTQKIVDIVEELAIHIYDATMHYLAANGYER